MPRNKVRAFNEECKVISFEEEYGKEACTGEEKYAIATNRSLSFLKKHFAKEIKQYEPFIIITMEMYEAIKESHDNDRRERIRDIRYHVVMTEELENLLIDELSSPVRICESHFIWSIIKEQLADLPPTEKSRLNRNIQGYTPQEIAEQDDADIFAVWKSLQRAREAMRNSFEGYGVADYE